MNACTIIARNYLAQARVLAESFREHHPNGTFTTLVLDGPELPLTDEPFRAFGPSHVDMDAREYDRMAAIYDVMQMATAIKPWFMRTLLNETREPVFYLDPDIEIFAPLEDLVELARTSSIVLTPHQIRPPDYERENVAESSVRLAGAFNLGFLGLAPGTDRLLDWWCERLARDCLVAPEQGIFVDQRWFDFVPAQFEHAVVRDPTLNVAWWNLQERQLSANGKGWRVNGQPLKFFHFSGFDPRKPHLLSKFQGPKPRILFSDHPDLARICAKYGARLLERGFSQFADLPYGFDRIPNGLPLDRRMRQLYRTALIAAEEKGAPEPPNPFLEPDEFVAWLREPPDPLGQARRVSRYLHVVYAERPDLHDRFHDIRWLAGDRFIEWVAAEGRFEEDVPSELVPEPEAPAPAPTPETPEGEPAQPGMNVVGYFRAEAGVGEAARQILAAVRDSGIPFTTVTYDATISRQTHEPPPETAPAIYDTNLICVNADQLPKFTWDAGPALLQNRYSIGMWWWEVAEFPESLHDAFGIVREIWVGSSHIAHAVSDHTDRPVVVFPLPVAVPQPPVIDRRELGLPNGFLFLFSFDFLSVVDRKNPLGLIEAFRRAFRPNEGPVLVVKSINGEEKLTELERLRAAAADRQDIYVIDRYLSADQKNALMASADAYVSLHRSEGFGLTLAESMAYGKPVIATGYSGNLEFMSDDNSYLVPYTLAKIPVGADPYPEGGTWADPDLDQAAQLMRHVYESPDEARKKGERGRRELEEKHSIAQAAEFVRQRFDEIATTRDSPPPAPAAEPPAWPASPEIEHAADFLANGPSLPFASPSRFGPFGLFARRILFRVLRPYMLRQREWELAVVEGLRQVEQRALSSTRDAELRATSLVARATEAAQRAEEAWAETHAALALRVGALEARGDDLEGELYARPYLASPDALTATDDAGRNTIGFANGDEVDGGGVYRGFEDLFRGAEPFIRDRQRGYVDLLCIRAPVLDIGCGRGELLDVLAEAGVEAKGVDLDASMVERAKAKGHDVEHEEGAGYLQRLPDASLGAITALHVVEHLDYEPLVRFLQLAQAKVRPDGILLLETVNPHALSAFKAFWVDLTHRSPIFPEVAVALCRLVGFASAYVIFPNGTGNFERDLRREGEYAVVATRG